MASESTGPFEGAEDTGLPAMATEPEQEVFVLTRAAVREVDRLAVERYGIPTIVLMENAAFHLADLALHLVGENPPPRVLVVCGPGNNGGDGLATARHLHNAGATVEIVLAGTQDKYSGEAAANLAIVKKMGLLITEATGDTEEAVRTGVERLGGADLVIDALLGTGLTQPVREPLARLIRAINDVGKTGALVLSADIPSGLDADSGEPLGVAVQADATVSFVGLKEGFLKLTAQGYIGDVVVADVGAPRELTAQLGRRLEAHELHDEPEIRPGHEPGPARGIKKRPGR